MSKRQRTQIAETFFILSILSSGTNFIVLTLCNNYFTCCKDTPLLDFRSPAPQNLLNVAAMLARENLDQLFIRSPLLAYDTLAPDGRKKKRF